MPIEIRTTQSTPGLSDFQLEVEVRGMTIVLKAGSFKYLGNDYVLSEDQEFEVAPSSFPREINGYVVKNKATGEPALLVDEVFGGGQEDMPYNFHDRDCPYELMILAYSSKIPANTTDLAGVTIEKHRIVPVSQEQEGGQAT